MKRMRAIQLGKQGSMNTPRFFLAGILCMSLPVFGAGLLASGALPQATNNPVALAKQSSITFVGTVSQVAATTLAAVPKSPQTIVVRVDSVLKKPAAVSLKKGDTVTVQVKDPAAFQEGTQATFYTEGWIFGSGVAVKELGHDAAPSPSTAGPPAPVVTPEKTVVQSPSDISDQDLQRLIAAADYVVTGRITDVHPWTVPKAAVPRYRTSEHSASWHEAVLQVQSVLKGPKLKRNKIVLRFPLSRDVAWVSAPKFEPGQQGVFILQKEDVSGTPATSGATKADVYTCLRPGDFVPMTEEPRVRSLLKK
jgi:hypothetical protein